MPRKCCVPGCKSNYDSILKNGGKAVSVFSFPRDENHRRTWIRAIPRADWTPSSCSFVCSEHFNPREIIRTEIVKHYGTIEMVPLRNPKLVVGAVPHIFPNLPMYLSKSVNNRTNPSLKRGKIEKHLVQLCEDHMKQDLLDQDVEEESVQHDVAILCNNCQNVILGFKYKCVTCEDYDLCKKCEMMEIHSEHYMLRIPKPLKYKEAADIGQKLKQIFIPNSQVLQIKEEDPIGDTIRVCTDVAISQDDNVNGDIHLSEQFKNIIQSEVRRVLDECKEIREPPLILRRNKKREVEREKVGDEKRKCYVNTKVNAAPEIVFLDTSSGFDTQESCIEVKQEMYDESELVSELDVGEIINPYETENHL